MDEARSTAKLEPFAALIGEWANRDDLAFTYRRVA
jgi:hypothetical protein